MRLYRRHDGTVLTADCSYFRRAVELMTVGSKRMGWILACGFAAVIGAGLWAVAVMQASRNPNRTNVVQSGLDQLSNVRPIAWVIDKLGPPQVTWNGVLGRVALTGAPAPQGQWIASGPRGFEMGDTIQGEVWAPPPAVDPRNVLQLTEPPAPPL